MFFNWPRPSVGVSVFLNQIHRLARLEGKVHLIKCVVTSNVYQYHDRLIPLQTWITGFESFGQATRQTVDPDSLDDCGNTGGAPNRLLGPGFEQSANDSWI